MAKLGITIQHMDRYFKYYNTYTSAVLTQTTQFRAVVQSGSCAPANSTTTTVTVDQGSVGGSVSEAPLSAQAALVVCSLYQDKQEQC